ncbi:MAG: antitoxin, RHH family protein [Gaiellales bacterium]|nr:MAG: antitoxin, RHH family protein [Gaiellales bacterium]
MPAKNPRVNVVLEKPLYNAIHDLAEDEGVSMSMLMRDLVKEAFELREDRALAEFATEREKGFDRCKALRHEDVWGK